MGLYDEVVAYWCDMAGQDWKRTLRTFLFMHRWSSGFWSVNVLNECMEHGMARGKANGKAAGGVKAGAWTEFVDIPLGGVSWEDVQGNYASGDSVVEAVSELLSSGYRVSFSYNPANQSTSCSVTCRDDESPNSGKTFTAFGEDWYSALLVALYKHYVIASEDWSGAARGSTQPRFG